MEEPLHETLATMVRAHGAVILDDPAMFRAAMDDFVEESAAPPSVVNQLVDAVRFGVVGNLRRTIDAGAPPAAALDDAAERFSRERGATDPEAAREVCALIGYASGLLPPEVLSATSEVRRAGDSRSGDHEARAAETVVSPDRRPDHTATIAEGPGGRRSRRPVLLVALAVALLLVVVGGGGVAAWKLLDRSDGDQNAQDGDRTAPSEDGSAEDEAWSGQAVEAARNAAAVLLSYDYRTIDSHLDAVASVATDRLQAQFRKTFKTLKPIVLQHRAVVTVTVLSATLTPEATSSSAPVLLSLNQQAVQKGKDATYKESVVLTMVPGDGGWLADELENKTNEEQPSGG